MSEQKSLRKERSDKKIDVKPTIPSHLFDSISELCYVIDLPIKDVVEFICMEGIGSKCVIEMLSPHFKRDYQFNSTIFIGNKDIQSQRYLIRKEISTQRISTRLTKEFFEHVNVLAYALDKTPTTATGVLLEVSMKDISIIDKLIKPYTHDLKEHKKKVLKKVIRYIRKDNPLVQSVSFSDVFKYLVEWLKEN